MKYEQFKRLVLEHLDQYQIAGDAIPRTYDNQADYTDRIRTLANDALYTIATTSEPQLAEFDPNADGLTNVTNLHNGWYKIEMPQNFWRLTGRGLPRFLPGGRFVMTNHYQTYDDRTILVPAHEMRGLRVQYYKIPTANNEELDCSEPAAHCASFYVAAQLARHDNPYAYQSLYNEFEQKLARLQKPQITELARVEDAYDTWYGDWIGCL